MSVLVVLDIEGDEQLLDLTEEGTVICLTWQPTLRGLWSLWRRGQAIRVERCGSIKEA